MAGVCGIDCVVALQPYMAFGHLQEKLRSHCKLILIYIKEIQVWALLCKSRARVAEEASNLWLLGIS